VVIPLSGLKAGPVKGSATGRVSISAKIVSMADPVKVDGKEIEAVRVDSVLEMDLSMNGRKIPSQDFNMTNWYTKETSLLKQTATTQFGKTGIEYVAKK